MREWHRDSDKDDSTLPDELAKERTQLAKERTLLAYVRTALAFLAVGAGFMQFFEAAGAQIAAWVFIAAGIGLFLFGMVRFRSQSGRREA